MIIVSVAAAVVALTLVVIAAFLIPALVEIKKTTVDFRNLMNRLESEVNPALVELRATLADLKTVTESASAKAENLQYFMEAVGETGRNLRAINSVMGAVSGTVMNSSLWLAGTKVAVNYLIKRYSSKKGGT